MPYVYDPNLEQDKDSQNQAGQSGSVNLSQGSTTPAGTTSSSASGQSQAPASGKKALDTGSGYQNLDKYLQTNQSQQFGNQVLGKVQGTLDSAKQNQSQATNQFTNAVNSSNSTPDQATVNDTIAKADPTQSQTFQGWMNQSYQGPKSLAEDQDAYNKYWSGTNQAQTNAQQLGSEAGRFSLLDSYFGKPQYNFGQKSLDNLLVQQSGLGSQTQNIQNQAAQLKSQGDAQAKTLQGVAATRAGQVDQNRQMVNNAFDAAQSQAQGAVNQTLTDAQAQRTAQQQKLQSDLTNGSLDDDELSSLGLQSGQNLYNTDLTKYMNSNSDPITKEQVATDDQRSRLNALSQLAGQSQSYLGDKQDLGKAYGFDLNKFNTDAQAQGAAYNSEKTAANTSYNNQIHSLQQAIDRGLNTTFKDNATGQVTTAQQRVNQLKQQQAQALAALDTKYQANRKLNMASKPATSKST
jgi:hypothetical protein